MSKHKVLHPLNDRERLFLLHDPEDPSTWKVLRQQRGWLGWKTISTLWFISQAQAEAEIALRIRRGKNLDLLPQM